MTYSGNPALAPDIQERILEAYRHSVESASQGNPQEALLGCDFVLRLDPQFQPAKTLQQMLAAGRSPESFRDLIAPRAATGAAAMTAASSGLVATFARLLEARRFEELLSAAQAQGAAVAGDPKLRDLVAQAQSRFEAEPFIRDVLEGARRAIGAGRLDDVAGLLDKARSLDPTHPGLAEVERLRAAAASVSTSLKIDWDAEDGPAFVPPPSFDSPPSAPGHPFVLPPALRLEPPAPPPPAAPAPIAFAVASPPSFEAFGATPGGLDLPDLDFSVDTAPGLEPDFGTGEAAAEAAPGDEESDTAGRVQALLDEGEGAFERGEYQGAIDAWSRIFLIDIDNEEAARRIERARQLKAEHEREVEEIFHNGVSRFDAGDWAAAKEAFTRVLDAQPSYILAREYLEKIEEHASGRADGGFVPTLPATSSAPRVAASASRVAGPTTFAEEILVPPDPGAKREARRPAVDGFAAKARRSTRPSPLFLAIGGAVLALLAAGGWFLHSRWERFFPNAPRAVTAPAPNSLSTLEQARKLQAEGKTAMAIGQLRRIPSQDPAYGEAQSLVSQWEKLAASAQAAQVAPERAAERHEALERARAALTEGENLLAVRLFTDAGTIAPLDAEASQEAATAQERTTPLARDLQLFRDGEYEMVLNHLWRQREADPGNKDLRRLMVDAYYDLSVAELQRGNVAGARDRLREARALDRDDPMLERLERFATTYERRDPDLLYRVFVKYLPTR
jgi:tetratricopeptide (TPR) repeat protein